MTRFGRSDKSSTGDFPAVSHFWEMLSPAQQQVLLDAGHRHTHPAASLLIREGERSESVLVLLAGHVKIIATGETGHESLLAIRGPGDVLGELATVEGGRRSATVIAIEAVEVLRIPTGAFITILRANALITFALLMVVSSKLRSANARRLDASEKRTRERVSAALAELAADYGVVTSGEIRIRILKQDELAKLIGASREAVVRALRELRRAGIIRTQRGEITLLRPDLLGPGQN